MKAEDRNKEALNIAFQFSQFDGGHHKAWVIDQMVRALLEDGYDDFISKYKNGDDGPDIYEWDVGIPP